MCGPKFQGQAALIALAAWCWSLLAVAACSYVTTSHASSEDESMAVYVNMHCRSCGKSHKFCLPKQDAFSSTETYEYVCPSSGDPGEVTPGQKGRKVKRCPTGHVKVKRRPLREP
jgi:hypothetical protein